MTEPELLPSQCATIESYRGSYRPTAAPVKNQEIPWLIGVTGNPYYLVAPKYVGNSAGIRVLYALGRALNRAGLRAYMVDIGLGGPPTTFGGLDYAVPQLTRQLNDEIIASGAKPIVMYPETIVGNPLNARCVVRYVANFPGLLGGEETFDPTESVWAFGSVLAKAAGTSNILTVPTSDPRYWTPGDESQSRDASLVYAPKYRLLGGTPSIHPQSVEINRDYPSGAPLRDLLRRSKRLYLYENSALAIEAMLCGCPVVWMPNELLHTPILIDELGWAGSSWGDAPKDVKKAHKTVSEFRKSYERTFVDFQGQLELFIRYTQDLAHAKPHHFLATPVIRDCNADAAVSSGGRDASLESELAATHLALAEAQEFIQAVVSSRSWRSVQWWRRTKQRMRRVFRRHDSNASSGAPEQS